jgi:hypothetical protein
MHGGEMMKALLSTVWMLVAISTPGISQSDVKDSVREKLIGSWRLAWDEEQAADGKMFRPEQTGVIMYTRDGHMAVQIMLPEGTNVTASNPVKYDRGSYEAYSVTHHVEGALVRSLIGKNLTRVYRFEGRQLILKSSRPDEHWTIAWERN